MEQHDGSPLIEERIDDLETRVRILERIEHRRKIIRYIIIGLLVIYFVGIAIYLPTLVNTLSTI